MAKIKLGLVGVGKIARDQHLPVIAASEAFELVAVASRNASVHGVASFENLAAMLAAHPEIEAVSLCTPPAVRGADARLALESGRHVMLEKPPAATLSDVEILAALAMDNGVCLYASWHSRHANGVESARAWLANRAVRSVEIVWKENIREWHAGQNWILDAGGLGVFDPGINALSIATYILPRPFALTDAELSFPANRQSPIAARLSFRDEAGASIEAEFDFLQTGEQTWDIHVATDAGRLTLSQGGALLRIGNEAHREGAQAPHAEYAGIYARFAGLVRAGRSDVDTAPLRHVADALLRGRRVIVAPFVF